VLSRCQQQGLALLGHKVREFRGLVQPTFWLGFGKGLGAASTAGKRGRVCGEVAASGDAGEGGGGLGGGVGVGGGVEGGWHRVFATEEGSRQREANHGHA
jgi:hypothetical protein